MRDKLTKKYKAFCKAYSNKIDRKTYGVAYASAISAGYSPKRAYAQGSLLLKKDVIKKEIARIEQEEKEKYSLQKDDAILEARKNYELAVNQSDKKFWYNIWVNLQSWLVQKTESIVESKIKIDQEEKEEIAKLTRQSLQQAFQQTSTEN